MICVAVAGFLAAMSLWSFAMTKTNASTTSTDDPSTIASAVFEKMQAGWNGAGDGGLSMFTEDVDFINSFGPYWQGIKEIAAGTQNIKGTYKSKASYKLAHASEIAPGVILAIANATATIPEGQPLAGVHPTTQSILLVKRGTGWKIRFLQTTPVVPPPKSAQ
jgi:uncharacterized protein (TIGR02246 family)